MLPQFFGLALLAGSGPAASLILVALVAYAMVRHRLLDSLDFVSRGIVFLFGSLVAVATLAQLIMGRFDLILPSCVVFLNVFLGIFVLLQNWRNNVNRTFAFTAITLGLWTFSIFIAASIQLGGLAFWWLKAAHLFGAVLPALILYLFWIFPRQKKKIALWGEILIFIPAVVFAAAIPFNLLLKSIENTPFGYKVLHGPFYVFYSVYFFSYLVFAFYLLLKKLRLAQGREKNEIKYLFLGALLTSILAASFNIVLPLFGNESLWIFGPYSTVFLICFTTYAILKHRLMSIEFVLQRSTVYAISTVLTMAFYALAVIVSETFFRRILGYTSLIITALAALFIAVMYQPLIKSFQGLTDRVFFRERYDYQKTLQEISQKIASVIKLEELTHLIASTFIDTMKVSEISFLLLDRDNEHFRSVPLLLSRYKRIEIDITSPIVSWLCAARDILVKDEIEDEVYRQESLGKAGKLRSQSLKEVFNEMERLGISVWVPIMAKDRLIGIIALGNKLSGDVFTTEDLGLLNTLASQTAVVLENARLYDEVVGMKNYNEEVLESMVSGVLTADFKGRVVTFNNMAEKITGRKVAEVLGKNCEDIWGKRGVIVNVIENTLQDNKCYVNFEASIASPERGIVPVSFSSTALCDRQGKKIGVLLTIQDLSEVKELEGKVRRADKLAALATMAAGMAHEIKNPLSSMKVLAQLLPIKFDDPEYRKKLGEIFPREINRIDRIVESLLGFTRASALVFEKVDINSVLKETVEYLRNQAEPAEIKISDEYSELPEIEVDNGQISQVFSNLILNAIQAMQNGGEIKVKTYPGKMVEDILQNVKIEIADNGPGIAEDTLKKLFDPFFTTKYGGTGLGLTITHSIVDGHKGYIDVQSKVGQGTTFVVTLPVSQGLL